MAVHATRGAVASQSHRFDRLRLQTLLLALLCLVTGCAAATSGVKTPQGEPIAHFDGATGTPQGWDTVVERAGTADVVLFGELHGHPAGLELAARLFEALSARTAWTASFEFFERDEQADLDAYLGGTLTEAQFRQKTDRQGDAYPSGHRAIVERARALKLPVIAANAPRSLAKIARVDGYDALRALPPSHQAWFAIPDPLPGGAYYDAFAAMMGGHGGHGHGHGSAKPDPSMSVDAFFRAQALWDATMAESVVQAADAGQAVFHVVGRFHVDNDGGLVQLVRRANPDLSVLVLSCVEHAPAAGWVAQDAGRADIVTYVGEEK